MLEGQILPLYGGYAFCPWNVDERRRTHAPTSEYLFQSYHDNSSQCIDFAPPYAPESYPFACCEMGGGMQVWYQYRFTVPAVSVEAMALHKIAGGCNFVGYYMYHGGSNPIGLHSFMNEHVTPKISYDFQAPLGEFGQARASYHGLRLLHLFLRDFSALLCPMATVLPASNSAITPTDTATLRFAARAQGDAGFVFLNNYQDHAEMRDQQDVQLALELAGATIHVPRQGGLTLRRDVCAILPINLDLCGARLAYATTQLITSIEHAGETVYFFFAPEGMCSEYCFECASIAALAVESGSSRSDDQHHLVTVEPGRDCLIRLTTSAGEAVAICTLSRQEALGLWKIVAFGAERIVLAQAELLPSGAALDLVSAAPTLALGLFPDVASGLSGPSGLLERQGGALFMSYTIAQPERTVELDITHVSPARAVVRVPADALQGLDELILQISYRGDVGYASANGQLLSDNFANGAPWEIGLRRAAPAILGQAIELYISPLREGQVVQSDSAMAAQQRFVGHTIAEIDSITAVPRYRARVSM